MNITNNDKMDQVPARHCRGIRQFSGLQASHDFDFGRLSWPLVVEDSKMVLKTRADIEYLMIQVFLLIV